MELVLEQPEVESTDVLAPTPLRSVPSVTVEPPRPDATSIGSSEDADVAEVDSGLKRKRATVMIARARQKSAHLSYVEATSDSSAPVTHAAQSPPQTGPKAFEDYTEGRGDPAAKDTVGNAQSPEPSLREQERADAAEYKASCHWAVKYLEGGKNNHFAGLDDFCQKVEGLLEKQEEKLRKLGIEYDEELALTCCQRLLSAAQLERDTGLPIDVKMAGYPWLGMPPRALRLSRLLSEAGRGATAGLAKEKGVKGKASYDGVGAAHLPLLMSTLAGDVSPKIVKLLGSLRSRVPATNLAGQARVVGPQH
ncbi:hypothetical protein Tco_0989974 [Tanacetum coccineum]|uniref:Uncharacterized protein n=1 Tax=Tanacetum coccineum TaxID=301880 RepID=A0ABQ5EVG0_9ASTR